MSMSSAEAVIELVRETEAPLFVINLCASTTPVALTHPDSPELKRYTFFVTRQREEGRERFRLHMGYFDSMAEADHLLVAVRDVYPAAWVGPAPGNRAAPRPHGVPRAVKSAPLVPVPVPVAVAAAAPVAAAAVVSAPIAVVAPAPVAQPVPPAVVPVAVDELATTRSERMLAAMSNVAEVLAELADEPPRSEASQIPSLPAARIPELKAATPRRVPELKPVAATATFEISDSQALRILEQRTANGATSTVDAEVATSIRMLAPEDTQTLRAIKLEVQSNAQTSFAVQLLWSVSPIDMEQLPHLAIFDAYTLYNVEGNRQGRRWYGLRLGFFSDANSAKQVAYYVRSDYTSVAVVPVTVKERDRATGTGEMPDVVPAAAAPAPAASVANKLESVRNLDFDGLALLQDDTPPPAKRDMDDVPRLEAAVTPAPVKTKAQASAPTKTTTGKRAIARKPSRRADPGAPNPLEETLELLGASTLTIDEGRELINDSGVRKPVVKPKKGAGSRFARLLSSLSERIGDSRR